MHHLLISATIGLRLIALKLQSFMETIVLTIIILMPTMVTMSKLQHPFNSDDQNDRGPSRLTDSYDSLDSFDEDPEDSLSRSHTERRPERPPLPVRDNFFEANLFQMRQLSETANPRPISYNMAIHEQYPQAMPRTQAIVIENPLAKAPSIRKPTVLSDAGVGVSDGNNRFVIEALILIYTSSVLSLL